MACWGTQNTELRQRPCSKDKARVLRDDQDLEILVVNEIGREIHREFVHREPE